MVSPLLLLGAGVAVAAAAGPKKKPEKELEPGVPDNAKTRAYSQAVRLIESVARGRHSGGQFFNGVYGGVSPKGLPTYPILTEKDLPKAPEGWVWSEVKTEHSAMSRRSAPLKAYWRLSYQGAERLPEEIRKAVPEKPSFAPATPHIPASGYSEMIDKMKEGMFYVPPGSTEVSDIQF